MGLPAILSEVSVMTGLTIEVCVLIVNVMFATLFLLTVFCLAREFLSRPEYALFAALMATLAPRFIDTTYWDGSARGPAVVLMTLFVFIGFRATFMRRNLLLVLGGFVFFACFAVHHMSVLFVIFGFGFVLANIGARVVRRVYGSRSKQVVASLFVAGCVLATLGALSYFNQLEQSVFSSFGEGGFLQGESGFLTTLVNMAVSYTHQIGFVLVLALLGFLVVLRSPVYTPRLLFPFAIMLAFVPVLGSSLYISMLLTPFIAIAGMIWIREALKVKRRRRTIVAIMVLLVTSSLVLPIWSVARWNTSEFPTGDQVVVDDQVFNDALYITMNGQDWYGISNQESLSWQLQALTDAPFLRSGVPMAENGWITKKDIENNLTRSQSEFPKNLYLWLKYKDEHYVDSFIFGLMSRGTVFLQSPGVYGVAAYEWFSAHPRLLIIVDNNWQSRYSTTYGSIPSVLMSEIRNAETTFPSPVPFPSYVIYQSQRVTMYIVDMPIPSIAPS